MRRGEVWWVEPQECVLPLDNLTLMPKLDFVERICGARRRTTDREVPMCRNIRTLHNFEPPATEEEIQASALQYVRKLSGTTQPSRANEAVFARAVEEVAAATRRLLDGLVTTAAQRDRDVEAAKARERSARRFSRAAS